MKVTLCIATLIASAGCDGVVRARVKVVSASGAPISDAVIRLDDSTDHDLARFTDNRGCAYFSGVVAPGRQVSVAIDKPGYQSKRLKVQTIQENCLVVGMAGEGESGKGSIDTLTPQDCPCDSNAGHSLTLSARFKAFGSLIGPATDGRK